MFARSLQPTLCHPTKRGNMRNRICRNQIHMQLEPQINYEKLHPLKPNSHATKTTNQLLYNYVTTSPWKYGEFKNKMPCQIIG